MKPYLIAAFMLLASLASAETITATVPETDEAWPMRAIIDGQGPFIATIGEDELPVQWETHLRTAGGGTVNSWIAVSMPAGLEPGERVEVEVVPGASSAEPLKFTTLTNYALGRLSEWDFYVQGIKGGVYKAEPVDIETVRSGPVEYVWRIRSILRPNQPELDAELQLPHFGALTMDLRVWPGMTAMDVRLLWEGGIVDDPNAWALFDRVVLQTEEHAEVIPIVPIHAMKDLGAGMIQLAPHGGMLPHSAKIWSLGLIKPGDSKPTLTGSGWGTTASQSTALGVDLRDLGVVNPVAVAGRTQSFVDSRKVAEPLGGASPQVPSWRHPYGLGYGGVTGGYGIGPWPLYAEAFANRDAGFQLLTGITESLADRTRVSLLNYDATTWWPTGVFNFSISPELLYGISWQTNWASSSQDPFKFRSARPDYRELTKDRYYETMAADRMFGTIDGQHWCRTNEGLWPLMELYREPIAMLYGERLAAACIADFYHVGTGAYTASLAEWADPDKDGTAGRELAWEGWHVSLVHALGTNSTRAETGPWLDVWCDFIRNRTLDNGALHVIRHGKELEASWVPAQRDDFWPAQTYQQMFLFIAACQVTNVMDAGLEPYIQTLVKGMTEMSWGEDQPGPDYRHAVQMHDGTLLFTREDVTNIYSTLLHSWPDGNVLQTFHTPLLMAAGLIVGVEIDRPMQTQADLTNRLPYLLLKED